MHEAKAVVANLVPEQYKLTAQGPNSMISLVDHSISFVMAMETFFG